jgi:hypothetical protein
MDEQLPGDCSLPTLDGHPDPMNQVSPRVFRGTKRPRDELGHDTARPSKSRKPAGHGKAKKKEEDDRHGEPGIEGADGMAVHPAVISATPRRSKRVRDRQQSQSPAQQQKQPDSRLGPRTNCTKTLTKTDGKSGDKRAELAVGEESKGTSKTRRSTRRRGAK